MGNFLKNGAGKIDTSGEGALKYAKIFFLISALEEYFRR